MNNYTKKQRPYRHLRAKDVKPIITIANKCEKQGKPYQYRLAQIFSVRIETIKRVLSKSYVSTKKITSKKQG
jgi:hypothetical protein